jgi:hypothetical protein
MGNKEDKCTAAGIGSGLASVGGLLIMATTGPVGVVCGIALMSGGIGGVTNSIS